MSAHGKENADIPDTSGTNTNDGRVRRITTYTGSVAAPLVNSSSVFAPGGSNVNTPSRAAAPHWANTTVHQGQAVLQPTVAPVPPTTLPQQQHVGAPQPPQQVGAPQPPQQVGALLPPLQGHPPQLQSWQLPCGSGQPPMNYQGLTMPSVSVQFTFILPFTLC